MRLRKLLWVAATVIGGATLLTMADDSTVATRPAEIGSAFGSFDLSAIHQKTEACRATADERKFDRIGWATKILDAEKLAPSTIAPSSSLRMTAGSAPADAEGAHLQ